MIGAVLVVSSKGEALCTRYYRGEINKPSIDAFCQQIIATKETGTRPPVIDIDNASFCYTRINNLYFVAATRLNSNALMVFEFLYQFIRILKSYLGDRFDENAIRSNVTLLFELFDEIMDYGYPQNCAIDVLRLYINLGESSANTNTANSGSQLTSQITGIIDWRAEGIRHRKNEVYIDVLESINYLKSSNGAVLKCDVSGTVQMKSQLSGMPECKFGLNDKISMDKEGGVAYTRSGKKVTGVEIDDVTFHRSVRLGKFDSDRTITFIPPDGEFELMRYRVTNNVNPPFEILPVVREEGRNRVLISIKMTSKFDSQYSATNVVVKIPLPPNVARTTVNAGKGWAKFEPSSASLVWRIRKFNGGEEAVLSADVDLLVSISQKVWSRPPISLDFKIEMLAASGVTVRFLKVYERSGYVAARWVRFLTRAGEYQIRF